MLVVVSPAKKLDMSPLTDVTVTEPRFPGRHKIGQGRRSFVDQRVAGFDAFVRTIGQVEQNRFSEFGEQEKKAAVFAFAGDTYQGFEAATIDEDALRWAQDHLRILSGLYGLLRPLDEIEPYRLEMGSRLKVGRKSSLYEYWGDRIATELNQDAEAAGSEILVNCASQEYFGAVDLKMSLRVITPQFYEEHEKGPRIVSFYAKRARGSMARYIVENRIKTVDALCDFTVGGYAYQPEMSSPKNPCSCAPLTR